MIVRTVIVSTVPAVRAGAAAVLAASLVGCSAGMPPATSAVPDDADAVRAVLGGVELELEVARTPEQRARGLMEREQVPPGTGMVFLFDEPVQTRFFMFNVPVPLTAVFVRDGEVVEAIVMPPCEQPAPRDCPTYGPGEPFDTVVETAPETLPDVGPGDRLEIQG